MGVSKWPAITDREWPANMPAEYFETDGKQHFPDGSPKWAAISPMLIGMMRRIDELEAEVKRLEERT